MKFPQNRRGGRAGNWKTVAGEDEIVGVPTP